jgi:hypothetical protein
VDLKNHNRTDESNTIVKERVSNYNEFTIPLSKKKKIKSKDRDVWIVESHFVTVPVHWEI